LNFFFYFFFIFTFNSRLSFSLFRPTSLPSLSLSLYEILNHHICRWPWISFKVFFHLKLLHEINFFREFFMGWFMVVLLIKILWVWIFGNLGDWFWGVLRWILDDRFMKILYGLVSEICILGLICFSSKFLRDPFD
jgi:hypothetical protein